MITRNANIQNGCDNPKRTTSADQARHYNVLPNEFRSSKLSADLRGEAWRCKTFMDYPSGLLPWKGAGTVTRPWMGGPASKVKSKPTCDEVSPLGPLAAYQRGAASVGGAAGFIPNS